MEEIVSLLSFVSRVVGDFLRLAVPKSSMVSTTLDVTAGYHLVWRRGEGQVKELLSFCSTLNTALRSQSLSLGSFSILLFLGCQTLKTLHQTPLSPILLSIPFLKLTFLHTVGSLSLSISKLFWAWQGSNLTKLIHANNWKAFGSSRDINTFKTRIWGRSLVV